MPYRYSDGGRAAAGFTKEASGDCVVRAIALATGRPYAEVHKTVYEFGHMEGGPSRKRSHPDRGVNTPTMYKLMEYYGATWVPTMKIGQKERMHLADGELPDGRIIVRLSRHVAAVIDGVIYDNHDPQREGTRMVYGYWRF